MGPPLKVVGNQVAKDTEKAEVQDVSFTSVSTGKDCLKPPRSSEPLPEETEELPTVEDQGRNQLSKLNIGQDGMPPTVLRKTDNIIARSLSMIL